MMSRTDGHEPYWVSKERYGYVEHNHENGQCHVCEHVRKCHRGQCDCYDYRTRSFACEYMLEWWRHRKYCGNDRSTWEKATHKLYARKERHDVRMALHAHDWERAEWAERDKFWYYD